MKNATYRLAAGLAVLASALCVGPLQQASAEDKPLKVLMLTGGGHHDYKNQKTILSEGIGERLDVEWTIHHEEDSAKAKAYMSQPGWSDGYDAILYNVCYAAERDGAFVDSVAEVHAKGMPAVMLHCTMHSYHFHTDKAEKTWLDVVGVYSRRHGPHRPFTVTVASDQAENPIVQSLKKPWVTPKGELYYVQRVMPTTTVLAYGKHDATDNLHPCVWTNQYKKGRIFGTTIGHHNETMQAPQYLDLVTNGLRWAVDLDASE